MPTPVFEFDLSPNTNAPMLDLAWDPWTWEVFWGQFTGGTISPPCQTGESDCFRGLTTRRRIGPPSHCCGGHRCPKRGGPA
jgi:hypothetical protein